LIAMCSTKGIHYNLNPETKHGCWTDNAKDNIRDDAYIGRY